MIGITNEEFCKNKNINRLIIRKYFYKLNCWIFTKGESVVGQSVVDECLDHIPINMDGKIYFFTLTDDEVRDMIVPRII